MRFLCLLVTITLSGLSISVNAAHEDDRDTAKLQDLNNSIKHHSGNITAIRHRLVAQIPASEQNVKDEGFSDFVLSVLSEISIESETLIERQSLLGKMESEQGKTAATARVVDEVSIFKKKCAPYLEEINLNLDKIKNNDLLFEVKNARDDVVKICGIIQR